MSTTTWDRLEPETRADIERLRKNNMPCTCEQRGERLHLCDYHEGYDDGVVARRER